MKPAFGLISGLMAAGLSMGPTAVVALPDPYRVEPLAPGVFAIVRKVPTRGASDSNVLFIINERDVVVVDTDIYTASARQAIAEIRKRTRLPVRYVINTHWHDDHVLGNEEYLKAYPGVEFIGHPVTRDSVIHQVAPGLDTNRAREYPAVLARLRARLASGRKTNGEPLTAADSTTLRDQVTLYASFLRDVRTTRIIAPTITVADSLVMHRGTRTIVVKWLGRGNTPGDVVVWLPQEGVLATGDLVVAPIPFGFGSFIHEWPSTLRALRALPAKRVMPGHGEVMQDWTYVDQLIAMLSELGPVVGRAVDAGVPLDSARKLVDFSGWRARFGGESAFLRRAFDDLFAGPIVEAAYARRKAP